MRHFERTPVRRAAAGQVENPTRLAAFECRCTSRRHNHTHGRHTNENREAADALHTQRPVSSNTHRHRPTCLALRIRMRRLRRTVLTHLPHLMAYPPCHVRLAVDRGGPDLCRMTGTAGRASKAPTRTVTSPAPATAPAGSPTHADAHTTAITRKRPDASTATKTRRSRRDDTAGTQPPGHEHVATTGTAARRGSAMIANIRTAGGRSRPRPKVKPDESIMGRLACDRCGHTWPYHAGTTRCMHDDRRRRDGLCNCPGWKHSYE